MSNIALVGTRTQTSALSTTGSIAAPARTDVQAGDIILVIVDQAQSTKAALAVTDNNAGGSNSYSVVNTAVDVAPPDDSSVSSFFAVAQKTQSITVTVAFGNGTTTNVASCGVWVELIRNASAAAIAGAAHTGQLQTAVTGPGTDTVTSGNATPSQGSNAWLIVGFSLNCSGSTAPGGGTGFTNGGTGWNFTFGTDLARSESKRVTSAAAAAATFNPVTTDDYITLVSIWNEAGGSGLFFGAGTTS